MTKKILIALTSHDTLGATGKKTGAYLSELTHAHRVFADAGFLVDFVSVKGGQVPLDGVDRSDATNAAFLDDAGLMAALGDTKTAAAIDPREYAAIYYAGGHGTMWDFPNDEVLAARAAAIYEQGGVVGAVCHGPAGLVPIRLTNGEPLVKGKAVAAFTNEEEAAVGLTGIVPFLLADALTARGARHEPAAKWAKNVVVSERLVTGQNPASAKGVAEAMRDLLSA
jgi:putative intracellular protease/amidase